MLLSNLLTFFSVVSAVWLPRHLGNCKTKISYSHSLEHYIILFAVHQRPEITLVLSGLVSYFLIFARTLNIDLFSFATVHSDVLKCLL